MKITKRQLRRIIKEEKAKILKEGLAQEENLDNAITEYVNDLADRQGVNPLELKGDVLSFVEGWFEAAAEMYHEDQDDEPGFMLPTPKEDPMGRGAKTSALRRSVMNK